jgi:NADPH-dependent F420 reductase
VKTAIASADVTGFANAEAAAKGTIVILAVPFSGQAAILKSIKPALKSAVLVDATVPLAATVGGRPTRMLGVWEGSAAQAARELLPGVTVVSAFHNVSADVLQDLSVKPDCDILICGDDAPAKERAAALVKLIPGLRPVDAGALEMSRIVESLTALLIALNRRHKVPHCGIRITGMAQ